MNILRTAHICHYVIIFCLHPLHPCKIENDMLRISCAIGWLMILPKSFYEQEIHKLPNRWEKWV